MAWEANSVHEKGCQSQWWCNLRAKDQHLVLEDLEVGLGGGHAHEGQGR